MKNTITILTSFALLIVVQLCHAGSATWNLSPASGDWNTAANWTPSTVPNDPSDTATFDVSNITAISEAATVDLAEIVFNPGASAFTISAPGILSIDGTGITNNSGLEQNFVVPGLGSTIHFHNSATPGANIVFTQTGPSSGNEDVAKVDFHETSNAGSATFVNEGNAQSTSGTQFYDSATAADGMFINKAGSNGGGVVGFYENSTAGNATIVCEGGTSSNIYAGVAEFFDRSTAGDATIILNGASADVSPGYLYFRGSKTSAGNATVIAMGGTALHANGGLIEFKFDSPSAGNATFIINGGTYDGTSGRLTFLNGSRGGTAAVKLLGNGWLDLSFHDPGTLSIGSLAGTGIVTLGVTNLVVGTNNFTTGFSGIISGYVRPPFASFIKTGSGNLALSGANDYNGSTFVQGRGTLFVNNLTGSGTGTGTVQVISGVLGGKGIISGPVVIGTGGPGAAKLMPGKSERSPAILTIGNTLTFNSNATYRWLLNSVSGIASSVVSTAVTIDSAALFTPSDLQSATLSAGTVFTVITNNGPAAIVGNFSNLPDGGTIAVGNNTFQANYEGGDGNDLTLTVVP